MRSAVPRFRTCDQVAPPGTRSSKRTSLIVRLLFRTYGTARHDLQSGTSRVSCDGFAFRRLVEATYQLREVVVARHVRNREIEHDARAVIRRLLREDDDAAADAQG